MFPGTVVVIIDPHLLRAIITRAPEDGDSLGYRVEGNTLHLVPGTRARKFARLAHGGGTADPWVVPAGFEVVEVGGGWGCGVCGGGAVENCGKSVGAEGEEEERDDLHLDRVIRKEMVS